MSEQISIKVSQFESQNKLFKLSKLIPILSILLSTSCAPQKPEKSYPWTDFSKPENQFGYEPPSTELDKIRYECIGKMFSLDAKESYLIDKAADKRSKTKIITPYFASFSTKNGFLIESYSSDSEKPEVIKAQKNYEKEIRKIKKDYENSKSALYSRCTEFGGGSNLAVDYRSSPCQDNSKFINYCRGNKYIPEITHFNPPSKK